MTPCRVLPHPPFQVYLHARQKVQIKPCGTCKFAGLLPGLQPSVLADDKVYLGRTWLGATKSSVSQCQWPQGSVVGTPCTPPSLPVPSLLLLLQGDVWLARLCPKVVAGPIGQCQDPVAA